MLTIRTSLILQVKERMLLDLGSLRMVSISISKRDSQAALKPPLLPNQLTLKAIKLIVNHLLQAHSK
jgi:hypothetical protein